jgi:tetrahydromethanopterin S-methyltransferase subunit F
MSTEDMIKEKMAKINAYRERLKSKSNVFSRNIKKESDSIAKRTSSKTESGIGGSSTQESQN